MKNIFNSVQMTKPNRNRFDLSHDIKLSCDMGYLVPNMCIEAIPGDKFSIGCDSLLRFAPLVAPMMHRVDVSMHYFFVPNRLIWPGWEDFITNTIVGGGIPAPPTFQIGATNWKELFDYFGIMEPPVGYAADEVVSALPFAAYQMIYNEFYRDQNLIAEVPFELTDGDNTSNGDLTILRKRAWEHDYFTSALPFAQKGPDVAIPLGDVQLVDPADRTSMKWQNAIGGGSGAGTIKSAALSSDVIIDNGGGPTPPTFLDPNGNLEVDATTINDLRRAFRLQEWLEKQARGGSRYVENILSHFGVRSSDKRLQRPEYITGVKSPVIVSEVLNTSDTASAPQGNMAGHAVSVQQGKSGSYYCEEHGFIIGIMSVMPKTAYQQGIPKHFLKTTSPFDYFWPAFANIGEQEIQNRELMAYLATPSGDGTFGYIPRYSEYKFQMNRIAGDFRDQLDFWHLARQFNTASAPALNQSFIECDPDQRIFAVTASPVHSIYANVLHKISASRLLPKYGVPKF